MQLKLTLPQIIEVDDYHLYDHIIELFAQLGARVKIKETPSTSEYSGMIYIGSLNQRQNKALWKKTVAEIREKEREEEEEYGN